MSRNKVIAIYPYIETNPYQLLLGRALEKRGHDVLKLAPINNRFPFQILSRCRKANAVHFHWVEGLYEAKSSLASLIRVVLFLAILLVMRARGQRVVYTLHNLLPHDTTRPQFHHLVRKLIVSLSNATIVHSQPAVDVARQSLGLGRKFQVIPHGHYREFYPNAASKTQARSYLGLPNGPRVALFFGSLIKYKCVDALVGAAGELARRSILLLIAGQTATLDSRSREALEKAPQGNVVLHERFVPVSEVQYFMKSADCMVLPYLESFTSGAAILGLSFQLPIVGSHTTAFKELIDRGLCVPCDPNHPSSVAGAIEEACSWDRAQFEERCAGFLANCGWDEIAGQHLVLYGVPPSSARAEQR